MSYQVLARQWRPANFSEVVGQQHVLQALTHALENNRLHHAYLLSGTRGVGKTTIARILAKSLNCELGVTANPCGTCAACVQVNEGRFVDLIEIDAASRTKVEDTREILDNVQYRPTVGRYKVYLIDEVHMLSRHSFNALLKTLEEPPAHVVFLLATTEPDKLPITVLSRCLQFNLRALTRAEIVQQLSKILEHESIYFEAEALGFIARAAQGSMRDALSLTDQAIAQSQGELTQARVAQMLGLLDPRDNLFLLNTLANGDARASLDYLRRLPDRMTDIGELLVELQTLLHQLALIQLAPAYLDASFLTHQAEMLQLAQRLSPEQIQVWYRIVLEGRREMPYAVDAFSGVEMTLLRLLSFVPLQPDTTKKKQPRKSQATLQIAEHQPERQPATQPDPQPERQPAPDFIPESDKSSELVSKTKTHIKKTTDNPSDHPSAEPSNHSNDAIEALLATRQSLLTSENTPQTQEQAQTPKIEMNRLASNTRTKPALSTLLDGMQISDTTFFAHEVDTWSQQVHALQVTGVLAPVLWNAKLVETQSEYRLLIDQKLSYLSDARMEHEIADLLASIVQGKPLHIEFTDTIKGTPSQIQAAIDAKQLEIARHKIENNPTVNALKSALDLTLIEDSIQVTKPASSE